MLIRIVAEQSQKSFFKFHAMWVFHERFMDLVRSCWNIQEERNLMLKFIITLKQLSSRLWRWNWEVFGDVNKHIDELRRKVEMADKRVMEDRSEMNETHLMQIHVILVEEIQHQYSLMEEKS
uniref:Uncharacterized protein n=1 Tax=Kalanchoe fedtschenkoi TaxID=63787 RepID=A0A7N0ZYQ0_KALFE